jgi:hypothetical protein
MDGEHEKKSSLISLSFCFLFEVFCLHLNKAKNPTFCRIKAKTICSQFRFEATMNGAPFVFLCLHFLPSWLIAHARDIEIITEKYRGYLYFSFYGVADTLRPWRVLSRVHQVECNPSSSYTNQQIHCHPKQTLPPFHRQPAVYLQPPF